MIKRLRVKHIIASILSIVMIFSLVPLTSMPASAYTGEGLPVTFTFEDLEAEALIGLFTPNSSAVDIEIGVDVPGGGKGIMATKRGTNYTSADNAISLKFNNPYPRGGSYRIIWDTYIPTAGNPTGANFTGPAVVVNKDYPGSTLKLPSSPAALGRDTWRTTTVTTPMLFTYLEYIDFRFPVNTTPQHPNVWYIKNIRVELVNWVTPPAFDTTLPSLAETFEDYFVIGNATGSEQFTDPWHFIRDTYALQYNTMTAGNAFKPVYLSPSPGVYTFDEADFMLNWAQENDILMVGHTLGWHSQSAPWLNASTVNRAQAKLNLEEFITTVAGRYSGDLIAWDVLNEIFVNNGAAGNWRNAIRTTDNAWWSAYGRGMNAAAGEHQSDYVYDAFVFARLADPYATLYYNDFNENFNNKRNNMVAMATELNNLWRTDPRNTDINRPLIEGFGMQSHYSSPSWPFAAGVANSITDTFTAFANTGLKISVTELDIPQNTNNTIPTGTALTTHNNILASRYRDLFRLYQEFAYSIERITLWGVADSFSWRGNGLPLPFDANLNAKPAFQAIIDTAGHRPAPTKHEVTFSSSGYGSIKPTGVALNDVGSTFVKTGDFQSFIITPDEGYELVDFKVNGVSVDVKDSFTLRNVTGAITIEAIFTDPVPEWSFGLESNVVNANINTLPAIETNIVLDNGWAVESASYKWFARIVGAAHVTGVPVPGAEGKIDLEAAQSENGFTAGLQLVDEWNVIPRLPAGAVALAAAEYTSEVWEYFVEVSFKYIDEVDEYDTGAVRASDDGKVISVNVRWEGDGYVRNKPIRDYFPNMWDVVDDTTLMPLERYLNDPFIFFAEVLREMGADAPVLGTDGRVETEEDWWERVEEIKDLAGYYWDGRHPEIPLENITVRVEQLNINDNSTATTQLLAIIRSNGRVATGSVGTITMPSRAQIAASGFSLEDGIPIVIGNTNAMWAANGVATLAFTGALNYQSVHPINGNITEFNQQPLGGNEPWMPYTWQISRALDALEILFARNGWGADPTKSSTIGVSIGGKRALYAGIMDDRVALTAPVESGGFGVAHIRGLEEGILFNHEGSSMPLPLVRRDKPMNLIGGAANWLAYHNIITSANHPFAKREDVDLTTYRLPFDQHLIVALAAPRALLSFDNDGTGGGNGWLNTYGHQLSIDAASEVYAFLGDQRGEDLAGNIAGRVRDQSHAVQTRDLPFVLATLKAMFGDGNNAGAGRDMGVVGPINVVHPTGITTATPPLYGFGTYATIRDMGVTPFEVQSRFIQWARPGIHSIWTYNEIVTEGLPFTINAHTTAPEGTEIELVLWNQGVNPFWTAENAAPEILDTWTAPIVNGAATFDIIGEVGRYELRFADPELPLRKSAFISGIDTTTALRSAASSAVSHMYRAFGFSSRINMDTIAIYIANAAGEDFYLPSSPLEEAIFIPVDWAGTQQNARAWGGWYMEYGIAVPSQGNMGTTQAATNNRLFQNGAVILRGLQLEAMPGFTFEVSFATGSSANAAPMFTDVQWPVSEVVQAAQKFPHWPSPGGLSASGGETGAFAARADGSRAFRPRPATNLAVTMEHSFNGNDKTWTISFSEPVLNRDFGIGFDFSDDFTLNWSEGNTVLTIQFNEMTKETGLFNMYILRLRDMANNTITAPVHHAIVYEVASVTPTARVEQIPGNQNRLFITVKEVYTTGCEKIYSATIMINNNAEGTYTVGPYKVFVDTKGNTQIRQIYIVG